MEHQEMIVSPCRGIIKKVFVQESERIYEWESLFTIKTAEGKSREVRAGLSGTILSLEVGLEDEVIPGMVLAYVNEDVVISGGD